MASALTKWLVDPSKNWFAAQHFKAVSARLRRFGLRYDDLYDPMQDLDIKYALDRLPREVVNARNQRLKRAMDLSMKHDYLSEEMQALQTPFRYYLRDMLALMVALEVLDLARAFWNGSSWRPLYSGDLWKVWFLFHSLTTKVKKENAERAALGALPLYQRTLP